MRAALTDNCELCGGSQFELLHRQDFVLPGDMPAHYDVSYCTGCGFAFARNVPPAEVYEAYYAGNTRYTYEGSKNVSPALAMVHDNSFRFVDGYLTAQTPSPRRYAARILDVGCATGLLLSCFKQAGYECVEGIDPAPECSPLAERLYGVKVETATISSFAPGRPYDVVCLSSVLEHLPTAASALERIKTWLAPGGLLFVMVPDAENFGIDMKEPFLEFSVEHIKYFTRSSLERLMAQAGFALGRQQSDAVEINGTIYPAIRALYSSRPPAPAALHRNSSVAPLVEYVARSQDKLAAVARTIDDLARSQEPVVVWGIGSLTARLMATTDMRRMNIVGFVDSASGLHGQLFQGREILAPGSLAGHNHTVLVASFVWAEAIRRTLLDDLSYRGRIVTL
jgi:SAM-dependent methyltransferase